MTDIIGKLAAWGCDTNSALDRFSGDKELYKECLNIFVSDNNFGDLAKALESKNVDGAFNSAHALKGVAGNLSLGKLYDAICRVSDALKAGDLERALVEYPDLQKAKIEYDKIIKE